MTDSKSFQKTDDDPESGCLVDVVDDGRVCYAYFLSSDGEIVGDV